MKRRYLLVGFAVFLALVAVLLVYGIVTHREAGFIEGAPQWDREALPLRVCARSYTVDVGDPILEAGDRETVEEAVSRAQARTGDWLLEAAVLEAPAVGCEIEVVIGVPAEAGWQDPGGHAELEHTGGRASRCLVRTSNTAGAQDLTLLTVYHELGHCLGLAHDDYNQSIMRPVQRPTPGRTIPAWLSDSDAELLAERYGPR